MPSDNNGKAVNYPGRRGILAVLGAFLLRPKAAMAAKSCGKKCRFAVVISNCDVTDFDEVHISYYADAAVEKNNDKVVFLTSDANAKYKVQWTSNPPGAAPSPFYVPSGSHDFDVASGTPVVRTIRSSAMLLPGKYHFQVYQYDAQGNPQPCARGGGGDVIVDQ